MKRWILAVAVLLSLPSSSTAVRFGVWSDTAVQLQRATASNVVITALPYAYTTTCTGAITLTGTGVGAGAVTWAASPSGDSGSCTGTTSWSCAVSVWPDAAGEGVETITVTQVGSGSASTQVGFYIADPHTCLLTESIDGLYNSTLTNGDALATWHNLGSSGLDVVQATGAQQPNYETGTVSGQPTVFFDGDDRMAGALASDWAFLHNGGAYTVDVVFSTQKSSPYTWQTALATSTTGAAASRGLTMALDDRFSVSRFQQGLFFVSNGAAFNVVNATPVDTLLAGRFSNFTARFFDGAGNDGFAYVNGALQSSVARASTFDPADPAAPLTIGALGTGTNPLTGYVYAVLIYTRSLSDVERTINQDVHSWALGGGLPRFPTAAEPDDDVWAFVGDSITAGSSGVTPWPDKLALEAPTKTFVNTAVSGATTNLALANFRAGATFPAATVPKKVFILVGINNIRGGTTAATAFSPLSTNYQEVRRQGSELYVMTILPNGNDVSWTAPEQVQHEAFNALITAASPVTAYIDLYTLMGEPGTPIDLATVYDVGDGLHPSEAGTTFMANTVKTALGL